MSNSEFYPFCPKLNRLELNLLYKMTREQSKRWEKLIEEEEDSPLAEDYQNDFIHLDNLLIDLKKHTYDNGIQENVSFSGKQTMIIMESLEYEFNLGKDEKSNFNSEEFHIIEEMRSRIQREAINEFGKNILKPLH